jgi:YD repeat-containing protein
VLLSHSYSYVNPATNQPTDLRYAVTDQGANTTTYSYDALSRLLEAKTTNGGGSTTDDRSYIYDAVGNRLSQDVNGATTNYTYSSANELTSAGNLTCSYDANGSLTGRGDGLSLSYNLANFTVSITPPGGSAIDMTYTGLDQTQRVQASATSLVYDLIGESQRTDGSGTTYDLRDNTGQLVSERGPTGTYYVLFDANGSTIGLTDSSGNLVST